MSMPAYQTAPAPPGRPRESSRKVQSSRRTRGSTGPTVTLGGGAGILGSAGGASGSGTSESHPHSTSPFYTSSPSPSAGSSHFPVQFISPTTPNFPSPISPNFSTYRAPSPLPPIGSSREPRRPAASQSSSHMQNPGSTSSLSTAASTSSRTLRTPQSKLDQHTQPFIAGSSSASSHGSHANSYDGHNDSPSHGPSMGNSLPLKERSEPRSPTPTQRTVSSRAYQPQSQPHSRPSPQPPTMSQSTPPVYPVPLTQKALNRPPNTTTGSMGRTRAPPAPLQINKKANRISQDWVQVENSPSKDESRAKPTSPMVSEPTVPSHERRLPAPKMIPMKGSESLSPRRPGYERSHTAPPLSPTPNDRQQKAGRGSLDQLRSTSPTPARGRLNSLSTPPAAMIASGSQSHANENNARSSVFNTNRSPPGLRTRRSEDVLRPSMDSLRSVSLGAKETKAMIKDQQRALGIKEGKTPMASPSLDGERKSSGLSLKKSSGALKALFNRGASKGKDKSLTPPVPTFEDRSQIGSSGRGRPSTAPRLESPSQFGARSIIPNPREDQIAPGRRSLGVERSMYPTPPSLNRAASQSSSQHPQMAPTQIKQRFPSRDSPSVPPVSPVSSYSPVSPIPPVQISGQSHNVQPRQPQLHIQTHQAALGQGSKQGKPRSRTGTPKSGSTESMAQESNESPTKSQFSTLAEALPASSLPYLSPLRASFLLESKDAATIAAVTASASSSTSSASFTPAQNTISPALSADSTARSSQSVTPTSDGNTPLATSRSLHLLSLPELDLDFDVTFDKFGVSPSTPKKTSPQKARRSPMGSPTPRRSVTTKYSPKVSPQVSEDRLNGRRSQSFDGDHSALNDTWSELGLATSPSISKLFAATNSSSAPTMSMPLAPTPSEDSRLDGDHAQSLISAQEDIWTVSLGSQPSAPPSLEHARSPSVASTTDDTPSPSPPRTPDEEERGNAFDFSRPDLPIPGSSRNEESPAAKPFGMGGPPSIPLPALPTASAPVAITVTLEPAAVLALAPSAIIEEPKPSKAVVKGPRENKRVLSSRSVLVKPDPSFSTLTLSREVERVLYAFRAPSALSSSNDRANMIRSELLPLLTEMDKRAFGNDAASRGLRETCFEWSDALMFELQVEQPANERGACLEALACIVESACLSERVLAGDKAHSARFTDIMVKCMSFVMSKLGAKGVFHNTLLFSGRFLAFAFFRIPHIGEQLVTVLQPPRGALIRFTKGSFFGAADIPTHAQPQYPAHLLPLCFDDSRTYTARLARLSAEFGTEKERDAFLFQPGNWLRRWQSDDSELFPAFYRAYHRQLAIYLAPAVQHYESLSQPLPASLLLRAPGYAHLATIFAKKCHSYILGSVNAVTTSSSNHNFEATETAGFRGSQKPAVLETANRRLVETMSTFATSRVIMPVHAKGQVIEVEGEALWSGMLDLWTKNLISKTSLYAPKGVFSLFDLLDGIVDPPLDPITGERRLTETSLLDVPHLIHVIRLILTEGEHALTLVKVIAFIFTHWEVLTVRVEDRRELCLDLLLQKGLFERLLLFWSQSVRSYVLRLVVFRLGHLHTTKADGAAHDIEIESVRLLQTRLERIKRRYDELEPKSAAQLEQEKKDEIYLTPLDGGSMPRSRSTITMVADSPRTGSTNKAEKLLGLGFGDVSKPGADVEENPTKVGKATSWLKKSFGNKKKSKKENGDSPSPSPNLSLSSSPAFESTVNHFASPLMPHTGGKATPDLKKTPVVPSSPIISSPISSSESGSPTSESTRKSRPPSITTTPSADVSPNGAKSPSSFAFEFELPTMSPRSDTFDPTPGPTVAASPRRNSQPPSPRQPQSPHMSRSFSKRSSLLPPPTASVLLAETPRKKRTQSKEQADPGYDKKLHAYAIRMLAELEDAQKEYDEWWSEGGIGRMDGAPPRLTVAWPFHEGED